MSLASACPSAFAAKSKNPQASNGESAERPGDQQETEIRQLIMDLIAAVNSGSAEKAASLWNSDAIFLDQFGEQWKGKAAIQARFDQVLKERPPAEISLHPEKVKLLAPNAALVVGEVSRKTTTSHMPQTRFSLVLTKVNGAWLIDEATETAIQEISAADHLREVEWLVGKWQCEGGPENLVTLDIQWGSNHNFILSKCTKQKNGTAEVDRQIIGWDVRTGKIVSWHFDCNGGYGYGKWSQDGKDSWTVDFAGVSPSGKNTRGINVFKVTTPTEFTWQSTQQSVDGASAPDCGPIKMIKNRQMVEEF